MIWGPGAPDLPEGYRLVDGVYVVDADHPELWRHLFSAPLIAGCDRERIAGALQEFSRVRGEHDAGKDQRLRSALIAEFRAGVKEAHTARAARRALQASRQRRHGQVVDATMKTGYEPV